MKKYLESLLGSNSARLVSGEKEYILDIESIPPCTEACPAGVNVKSYLSRIGEKRFRESLLVVLKDNPFPGICGRVCTHPCQVGCIQGEDEEPIAIKELKRFVADYEVGLREIEQDSFTKVFPEKVAVVGSGPAGLTCGRDLAQIGYEVVVFERDTRPGGMLVQCIPHFRLPRDIVQFEIEHIKRVGVKIVTSRRITDIIELLEEGFGAVVLAVGASMDRKLDIPGEQKENVLECLPFLRKINSGENIRLKGKVVVIGGGSSAFDAARTAIRCGAERVDIVYRRGMKEMPADQYEIKTAGKEGIDIHTLAQPCEIIGDEKVEGVVFLRTELGERGEDGRKIFRVVKGSEFTLEADWVIPAIGAHPDVESFSKDIAIDSWRTLEADEKGRTPVMGLFAGGDAVTGPSTIVDAIGTGHTLARSVHEFLRGIQTTQMEETRKMAVIRGCETNEELKHIKENEKIEEIKEIKEIKGIEEIPGYTTGEKCTTLSKRICGFEEVESGMAQEEALYEAARCLRCGPCYNCTTCSSSCQEGVLYASMEEGSFLVKADRKVRKEVRDSKSKWSISTDGTQKNIILESLVPTVDTRRCIGCGVCAEMCPYNAIGVCLTRGEKCSAVVELDICRGCGECQATCPTGAVVQKPFSLPKLVGKISELARQRPDEPMAFSSHWTLGNETFSEDIIEVMGTNALSSGLFLEALARGTSLVEVHLPENDEPEHYLASPRKMENIVEKTDNILSLIGHDHKRVKVVRGSRNISRIKPEEKYEPKNVQKYEPTYKHTHPGRNPTAPKEFKAPLKRTVELVERLMESSNPGPWTGEGCRNQLNYLQILGKVARTLGLHSLDEMTRSVERLARKTLTQETPAHEITLKKLVEKMQENLIFLWEGKKVDGITLLRSPNDEIYGADVLKKILAQSKTLHIAELKTDLTDMEWIEFGEKFTQIRDKLPLGCEISNTFLVVTTTPFSTLSLKLAFNNSSWRTTNIMICDIFTLANKNCIPGTTEKKGGEL